MRRRIILVFSVILVALTSCTTLNGRVKAAVSGYPLWYYEPSVAVESSGKSFVATGTATTERQAELLAYSKLADSVSSYLGYEISQENYRELVTLGIISEYSLSVEEKFSMLKNGNYIVFLLAKADYENLQAFRTAEEIERENKADRIKALIIEGDGYLKNNEDLNGVSCYLRSMVLSKDVKGLESQYSFDSIKQEVIEILRTTTMNIESCDSSKVTATLNLRRKESFLASDVQNCKILASYVSVDGRGNEYQDSFSYTTDKNGRIQFKIFNNAILKKGKVKFAFDLEQDIQALYEVDSISAALIEDLVDSKSVAFEYDRSYTLGKIGICVLEYDMETNLKNSVEFTNRLCAEISSEGILCTPLRYFEESDEVLLKKAFEDKKDLGCLAILKSGPIDYQISATGICSVTLEGQVVFYDSDSKIIYQSEVIYSNGFGTDYQNAENTAFDNMCRIVYTLLKASYV